MSQLRVVVLTAVAFVAAGFGSVAMAGCGGDNGCGGSRGGLLSRLHSKKAACGGAVAKDCSGGGMLSKLGSRRASKCSGAAVSNCAPAPAPAPACNTGCDTGCGSAVVSSDCGGCGTVSSESVMVGSAPCTNCSGTVNAGTVESSSIAPPAPATPSVPAAPTVPATPAVPAAPAAPASASDVPKA